MKLNSSFHEKVTQQWGWVEKKLCLKKNHVIHKSVHDSHSPHPIYFDLLCYLAPQSTKQALRTEKKYRKISRKISAGNTWYTVRKSRKLVTQHENGREERMKFKKRICKSGMWRTGLELIFQKINRENEKREMQKS